MRKKTRGCYLPVVSQQSQFKLDVGVVSSHRENGQLVARLHFKKTADYLIVFHENRKPATRKHFAKIDRWLPDHTSQKWTTDS